MALYKDHYIELDTKRSPRISLRNIVDGETGNRITVTLTNDESAVSLASESHRVCFRVDSDLGTRRQDSADENGGITFSSGNAIILLSKDTFTVGMNRCRLEIYTTASATYDTKIFSAEFQFTADASDDSEVNEWHRGSTPTHTFLPRIDLTGATISVTYEQNGKVVVTKTTSDMTVTSASVTWTLTQCDTLAMQVGSVDIQLHYTKNGVSDSSDIHKGKVLYTAGV